MSKIRFKYPRCGFVAGAVIDSGDLSVGVLGTLFQLGVVEELNDDKLDNPKNVKPTKSGSKPRRSKKASEGKR